MVAAMTMVTKRSTGLCLLAAVLVLAYLSSQVPTAQAMSPHDVFHSMFPRPAAPAFGRRPSLFDAQWPFHRHSTYQDAARQQAARQQAARQEAARQEAARQEAARQEAARQQELARRQELARQQEAARQQQTARYQRSRRDSVEESAEAYEVQVVPQFDMFGRAIPFDVRLGRRGDTVVVNERVWNGFHQEYRIPDDVNVKDITTRQLPSGELVLRFPRQQPRPEAPKAPEASVGSQAQPAQETVEGQQPPTSTMSTQQRDIEADAKAHPHTHAGARYHHQDDAARKARIERRYQDWLRRQEEAERLEERLRRRKRTTTTVVEEFEQQQQQQPLSGDDWLLVEDLPVEDVVEKDDDASEGYFMRGDFVQY